MNKKVTVDKLSKEVAEYMSNFVDVTEEACEKGVLETADDVVKALRRADPPGSGEYGSWDSYNRGWTIRKDVKKRRVGILAVVWNKDHYRLTHLLENGHAKVNGGRTRAFKHIAPVEERAEKELIANIRKWISMKA